MATIVTRASKGSPLTNTEVDANFTNLNTDKAELSGATFTGEIVANAGIALGDNDKATFGAGDDLQIYHTGSASIIEDQGTGDLVIKGTDLYLRNSSNANRLYAGTDVRLYHDANQKLATTSTGIDVTGTATMDGLTVDGEVVAAGRIKTTNGLFQADEGSQRLRQYEVSSGSGTQSFLLGKIKSSNSVDGGITGIVKAAYDYGTQVTNVNIHFTFAQRSGVNRGHWWYENTDDALGSDVVSVKLIDDGSNNYYVWLHVGDYVQCFVETTWRQGSSSDITDSGSISASTITSGTTLFDTANDPTSEHHIGKLYAHNAVDVTGTVTADALDVNGTIEFNGLSGTGAVTVTDILDEDNMASNSATALATQQSIKAYVDANAGGGGDVTLAGNNTFTGNNTFNAEITANGGIALGDNDKATFGAGDDLEIYHDGSHSYISDTSGTGDLYLRGSNLRLTDNDGTLFLFGATNADTRLYYSGSQKLATTATGIDVTGTATMDGLTVDGLAQISAQTNGAYALRVGDAAGAPGGVVGIGKIGINAQAASAFTYTATEIRATEHTSADYRARLSFHTRATTSDVVPLERLRINYNGDISFYEDTGTTAKLFWDASAESLGIGTSSPTRPLTVSKAGAQIVGEFINPTASQTARIYVTCGTQTGMLQQNGNTYASDPNTLSLVTTSGDISLTPSGVERLRVTAAGKVGIGTASPSEKLSVDGNITTTGDVNLTAGASDWSFNVVGNDLVISYGGANKAKLDTSGNLTVVGNVTAYGSI